MIKRIPKLLILSAMPAVAFLAAGNYSLSVGEAALRKAHQEASATQCQELLREVERLMRQRIACWRAYGQSWFMVETLRESNDRFAAMPGRDERIQEQDREWRDTPSDERTPLMTELLQNRLAKSMARYALVLERESASLAFPEAFVTNRFGVNIAQTNRTSDYLQSDERWWQDAMEHGRSVAGIEYDASTQCNAIGLCFRIDDENGEPLGVLKIVSSLSEIIAIIDRRAAWEKVHSLSLLTEDWRFVHSSTEGVAPLSNGPRSRFPNASNGDGNVGISAVQDDVVGELVSIYVRSNPGQQPGWIVLRDASVDTVLAPLWNVRTTLVYIGVLLAALLAGASIVLGRAKKAEQASAGLLRKAQEREGEQARRLQLALDAAEAGTWDWHVQADRNVWDSRTERLHGVAPGTFKGTYEAWAERVHPDDLPDAEKAVQRAIEDVAPYGAEFRAGDPEGGWRRLSARGVLVRDEHGQPLRLVGVVQDVTERRRLEDRFRATVAAAPIAMVMIDSEGVIVLANEEANHLFGYYGNDLLGQKIEVLVPEDHRDKHPQMRSAYFANPEARRMGMNRRLWARRRDGSLVPVEVGLNPIETEEGILVLSAILDISARLRMESELRSWNQRLEAEVEERTSELERSNKDLEQFAYVASHDLREPLRMVSSYLGLLERRYDDQLDQSAHEFIGFAVDGATRMTHLIDALLSYSRVGTGHGEHLPTNLHDVLAEVETNLHTAIAEHGAVISHDPLPTVPGDRIQLVQLFQNLIGNGIKYRGETPPHIHVAAQYLEGAWKFVVRDNGIGIHPKDSERVFGVFKRLHTREEVEGTGIGLAICKKIVEQHGGRIWVESEPGNGASFCFTLPKTTDSEHVASATGVAVEAAPSISARA